MVQPEYGITRTALRKVVFAARDESACKTWRGHSAYVTRMECLNEQDAFELFAHHAGNTITKDQRILQLAHEIAEECSGLPIALCKIGEAMSPKTEVDEWRGALRLLKTSNLDGISDGYEDVFQQLKISFDQIGKQLQNRFLICSLWPENENIPVEKLTEWWMGLGLIEASDRVTTGKRTICHLLSSSLLEKGDTGMFCAETSHVKMHKMFQKMAQWVVNNQGEEKPWLPLSLCERSTLPGPKWCSIERAWVSRLETGRWENNRTILSSTSSPGPPPLTMLISSHAFSLDLITCCQKITFLDLEGTGISEFPYAICSLREVQYLNLSGTRIEELPQEMRRLSKLKFLLVRDAGALQRVAKELIRSLIDLVMVDLFCSSGFSTHVEYAPSLLAELATPGIELALGFTAQSMTHLSELGKLQWVRTEALCLHHFEEKSKLVDLHLVVNLRSLRELTIRDTSENLELLIAEHGTSLLHSLNFLELNNLRKLKEIKWRNAGNDITVVNICHCDKLKQITWVCELQQLEQLTVTYCQEMEQLFSTSKLRPHQVVTGFPKMRRLYLENLPKLSIFFEKAMELDELTYVCITGCAKLKPLNVSKASDNNKIRLECDKDWWHGLGGGQAIMSCFKPCCCWEKVEDEEI
ncbi:hypothetical protein CFC21_069687 [Triticum aestivum]|uniref:Disease resistance protein At4g27190-like leucine-rich repeats domain-containing protein n=3 Tax=Triticum aestivum TaxID=4565 RepID=A0A3B6LFN5_WHEAT|nr:hypothetical protein CFC21_069687 [Triticum aestivum]